MNTTYEFILIYMGEFLLTMQKPSFHVDLCDAALEYLTKTYENIYNEELEEELNG